MRKLIHIVPGLRPDVDGVGDYAIAVAHALHQHQQVDSLFVVANPGSSAYGFQTVEGFPVVAVEQRDPAGLCEALRRILMVSGAPPDTPLLLHCSLYGFASRARAFWLVDALRQWKQRVPAPLLMTMFHELAASGPVWRSAFWLHASQCRILKRLAGESAAHFVSNTRYSRTLARIAGLDSRPIHRLPMISTIGEPETGALPQTATRKRQMIVFGQSHSRDIVFADNGSLLAAACRTLAVERILEIGPGRKHRNVGPIATEPLGVLDAAEISAVLRESLFGYMAPNADLLAKSSVFAAFCAHRMAVIVAGRGQPEDGLEPGVHYLRAEGLSSVNDREIASAARSACDWYGGHTSPVHARTYAQIAFAKPDTEMLGNAGNCRLLEEKNA
jgi:hypothetical protein